MKKQGPLNGLVRQKGESFVITKNGIVEARVKYKCDWGSVYSLVPSFGSDHPDNGGFQLKSATGNRVEGDIAELDCLYAGVNESQGPPPSVIEILAGNSQEPIETHKMFKSGGYALTDDDWKAFKIWESDPNSPDLNGWTPDSDNTPEGIRKLLELKGRGITDYLTRGTTVRMTSYEQNPPSCAGLCEISSPPVRPDIGGGNFLLINVSASQEGKYWRVSREWRASGPNGWDKEVYAP